MSSQGDVRRRIVAGAIQLIGKRYRDKARGPEEWDCPGVAIHAYKHAGFNVKDDLDYTNMDDGTLTIRVRDQFTGIGGRQIALSKAGAGDLILFKSELRPGHCGILDFDGGIIHACLWRRGVVQQPLSALVMRPCAAFTVVV
jgi:cell wall-associated NlpC family hydrolase